MRADVQERKERSEFDLVRHMQSLLDAGFEIEMAPWLNNTYRIRLNSEAGQWRARMISRFELREAEDPNTVIEAALGSMEAELI